MMDPIWAGIIGGIFGIPFAVYISRFNLVVVFFATSFVFFLANFFNLLAKLGLDAAILRIISNFSDPLAILLFSIPGVAAVFVAALARHQKNRKR